MTHLKIEQNNGIIEEVSSTVIDKLYDIVHSGNLDNTSNLIGRLHTTATYQDYIDYLEDTFKVNNVKLLIIDATKKYIMFADPVVASYWANSTYGDGTGIDITNAASVLLIPAAAFNNNTSIESFDELVKFTNCDTLKYNAFNGCSSLKSINLNNIIKLEENSFRGCSNLGSSNNGVLNIPKLSTLDGNNLFLNCTSLIELNIGSLLQDINKITLLKYTMFQGCTNLEKISGLNMVLEMLTGCFNGCTKLESIDTTSNLTSLYGSCFKNCSSLKCINLSGVTTVDSYDHFSGCTSLIDLSTNDPDLASTSAATYTFNWTSVPSYVFNNCKLTNKSFSFPNATTVGNSAFYQSEIVGIDLPNVSSLQDSSCFVRSKLTGILNLPKLTSVGRYPFEGCTLLTEVNIGSLVPAGSKIKYLGQGMFNGCTALQKVTGLSEITYVSSGSFYNCSSLEEVDISDACTGIIYYNSFFNCSSLKCVNISKATEILYVSFASCSNLLDLSTSDPSEANTNEKTITLAATGTIGRSAFQETKLTNKIIDISNVTLLGASAFASSLIKEIYAPNCDTLADNVFYNCLYLTKVTVKGSTSFGQNVFRNCTSLVSVIITSTTPATLGLWSFENSNNCPIYVPASAVSDYQSASGWSTYASRIQAIPT